MSPREKKLLIFFALGGFIILNLFAFRFYTDKKAEVDRKQIEAKSKLEEAQMYSASREEVRDEMDWLAEHEPQPSPHQDVQSALQQLIEREAQVTGLTIKPGSQKLLPPDETAGHHYHRAKVQVTVTGTDEALYTWLHDRINSPDQLRGATNIRLSPDREDDTKIDATVVIEQWFVPTNLTP
jgi:hypothetical protein